MKRRNPFEDMPESKMHCKDLNQTDSIMISNNFEIELTKVLEIKFLHYLDNLFGDNESNYSSDSNSDSEYYD